MHPLFKTPHDYQQKAIDSFFEYYKNPKSKGNPLIQVPTGGGKSLINAEIIRNIYNRNPRVKILCLTHTKEIIGQNAEELSMQDRRIKYGIYSSGLNQKCLDHTITFAGIQSIWDKHLELGHVDLIIIDEAHLCPNEGIGRYREFIDNMKSINPNIRILGLTATPWRLNGGSLITGEDRIFECIIYEITILELIKAGHLCTIVTPSEKLIEADFKDLKINKMSGDFVISGSECAISKIVAPALAESMLLAKDRKSWLIFCPSIKILEKAQEILTLNKISNRAVTGKTAKKERQDNINDFKANKYTALLTVDALTTGFNAKNVDCLICLRPTQSSSLWIQMLGRAMRVFFGKVDALLLDYGGNLERHGPIDKIKPIDKKRKKKNGEEVTEKVVKFCPRCENESAPNCQACPFCNYEYPITKHIEDKASCANVFSVKREPLIADVNFMIKARHKKEGMPDSVKVGYVCANGKTYFEWLCPEHTSLAKYKTMIFFSNLNLDPPKTVEECLSMNLSKPKKIRVDENGKYPEILERFY